MSNPLPFTNDSEHPVLRANGKMLSQDANRLGRLVPTRADTPLDVMRAQYDAQGYLWIRQLLEPEAVNTFRALVFSSMAPSGLLAPGSDPREGIAASAPPDKAQADRLLMALVRSARFEAFCMAPALVDLMDRFVGGLSYLHRRKIMRFTRPHTGVVTPAHYDLVYLRGGTANIVTAWIPIGDIPARMGGLVYLEGSHAIGKQMEAEFARKAADLSPQERISAFNATMTEGGWVSKDLPDMAQRFDTRWLYANFEAGDVMLHSPYMIHASTENEDTDNRMRLSTDIRYQNIHAEIDARWANHWSLGDML